MITLPTLAANWTPRREVGKSASMRDASGAAWLVPLILLVCTIVAVPLLIMDAPGLPRFQALSGELERARTNNQRLQREVEALKRQSIRLREDPRAVERIARDELGLIEDGELIFQFGN